MSLVCGQCSRVNPPEASYCYFDGATLAGRSGGPINAGSAAFPNQFVFPNGLACRNFDQLASACQQNWSAAVDLLKQGFLGSFFGSMGRVDLAMAAQEAAKFPDIDRGLDQLIAKLPTQAVQEPKLQAEPSTVNLGQVKVGEDRATELHLTNLGMRLLYGNVTSDCKWLTLGEAPGHPEKLFQFGADTTIPVQVRGQHLRAGTKPLEGHLTIDSNGGTVTVTFKADVPITPYQGALFTGAVTPREIATKAKAHVKEAAPYFENGDVAGWYASNGWPYPVQGPTMSGTAAIQQFFEALGVVKAPKVDFSPKRLELDGAVGKTVETEIEVTTPEKKFIYGWATCNEPWVEIGTTKLLGKTAKIPVMVRVPDPAPPTLEAILHVVGNGQQKLDVPIKIQVAGGKSGVVLEQHVESLEIVEEAAPEMISTTEMPAPPPTAAPAPSLIPPSLAVTGDSPFTIDEETRPKVSPSASALGLGKPAQALPLPVRLALHFAPMVVLFFCLLIPVAHDIFSDPGKKGGGGGGAEVGDVDPRHFVKIVFDEGLKKDEKSSYDSMMFAVHKINPDQKDGASVKLNWYENGAGNSTVLKVDNSDLAFGSSEHGLWAKGFEKGGQDAGQFGGKTRTFAMKGNIYVTQTVTLVPSDPVEIEGGQYKRLLDTCLVRYKIENKDSKKHSVGLRVLMDTCIGDRDDVPFTLPGVGEVVKEGKEFKGAQVPDFCQVLEKPSLREPGIIMQLGLRISAGGKLKPPDRFLLTHYPSHGGIDKRVLNKWDVPVVNPGDDSAVALYWEPQDLPPKGIREMAFTYGLGSVQQDAKLSITVGGGTFEGGEVTILALVADPNAKTATLKLPAGLSLLKGETLEQQVLKMRDGRPSPVTWRAHADKAGKHDLSVTLDTGVSKARRVTISGKALFN